MPQLQTPTAAMVLQASLQHVVLTYDPVNGRQIYVNGADTGVTDPQKGGTISNWDDTFALVLGNEVSSDRSWQGLIKFVAIHNRALTRRRSCRTSTPASGSASTCCSTWRPSPACRRAT